MVHRSHQPIATSSKRGVLQCSAATNRLLQKKRQKEGRGLLVLIFRVPVTEVEKAGIFFFNRARIKLRTVAGVRSKWVLRPLKYMPL